MQETRIFCIEAVCDQQFEFKWIDLQCLIGIHKLVRDRISGFLDAGKFRIARKSMLCLHGVCISVVTIGTILHLSDKWKQHRSMTVPDCRIGAPDPLEILCLIVDACKLGTVVGYRDF